ncbi:MAG: lipoate--protein ligase [Clostridia bacterium]|nr:lipoate--protein ligase [Clostridia bacterium]
MIETLATFDSGSFDPYLNLATEQHLLETVESGCCLLYLWQNQNTVVVGKNQNPWAECRVSLLESEGGHLARRLSGGGAVFHDLGNLNFTFLVATADYDLAKQQRVLLEACQSFGIPAELSGRNDLTADGRKFSGNAFYHNGPRSYHHGTLLVDVDGAKLQRYLTPSKAKLEAKGVPSVRSRVVNLKELCPTLTINDLKQALVAAFEEVYGLKSAPWTLADPDRVTELREQYAGWAWRYGQRLPFTCRAEGRFAWGGVEVQLCIDEGVIRQAAVYSDDMDFAFPPALEQALTGCAFRRDALSENLRTVSHGMDIFTLLQQEI